jgi:predicted GNAT family acetyltransferase
MALEDTPLKNNETHDRFEVNIDGGTAFINYVKRGNIYFLVHTQVPEELQGRGIAGALVEKTFKYLEEGGFKMMPYCPYVQAYLKRHPEWVKLVAGN